MVSAKTSLAEVKPPKAEKIQKELSTHGDVRVDYYYWLRDIKNPKVKKHLQAENKYFKAYFSKDDLKLKKEIVSEIKSKIEEDENSVVIAYGSYEYFSKLKKGKNYRQHWRRHLKTKKEEIIFDENIKAKNKKYFAVRSKAFSPNLKYLAWCFDFDGSGRCEVVIQDLKTLKFSKPGIKDVFWGDIAWAPDSKALFYTLPNKAWRGHQIWISNLKGKNRKVLEESDEQFNLGLNSTTDEKYVIAVSATFNETKNYYWDGKEFKEMIPFKKGLMVDVEHSDAGFFARSNHKNKNYGVYKFSLENPDINRWQEVVAPRSDAKLSGFNVIDQTLFYGLLSAGNTEIHHFSLPSKKDTKVKFEDAIFGAGVAVAGSPTKALIYYSSPVSPDKVYEMDLATAELKLLKEKKSPTLNSEKYQTELKFVKSRDGQKIPIHIVYRKDLKKDQPQALHLYSYGAYGMTDPSSFSETLFSLLDRGFIHVSAHIRGSDAQGEAWYEDGKMLNKKNTFNDFIDVARFLIQENWTSPEMLSIEGASAGGLLVGAVLNMEPELFRAAIAGVPFVDALTTMLDPTVPLTTQEYLQWGNPNEKKSYDYIKSYSPYDNIHKAKYPAIFADTGISDQQVGYWEPAKWVQKIREHNQSKHPVILRVNMGAGHGGASGRYSKYDEVAESYVFLIKEVLGN